MHIVLNIIISLQHHLSQLHDSHSKPETKTPPQLRHEHYQCWWHEVIVRDEDGVQKWYLNHIGSIESFRFMSQSIENVKKNFENLIPDSVPPVVVLFAHILNYITRFFLVWKRIS